MGILARILGIESYSVPELRDQGHVPARQGGQRVRMLDVHPAELGFAALPPEALAYLGRENVGVTESMSAIQAEIYGSARFGGVAVGSGSISRVQNLTITRTTHRLHTPRNP